MPRGAAAPTKSRHVSNIKKLHRHKSSPGTTNIIRNIAMFWLNVVIKMQIFLPHVAKHNETIFVDFSKCHFGKTVYVVKMAMKIYCNQSALGENHKPGNCLNDTLGKERPNLSEIAHGHLITRLEQYLLRNRGFMFAKRIKRNGRKLNQSSGFIDCTKLMMDRPGEINNNFHPCYCDNKIMPCQSYKT